MSRDAGPCCCACGPVCVCKMFSLTLPAGVVVLSLYVPALHTMFFVVPATVVTSIVLLYVFPNVALSMHRKGLMLEDLDDVAEDTELEKRSKTVFRSVFRHILILISSLAIGLIVDFAVIRFQSNSNNNLTFLEACGVMGGLMSLLKRIHMISGKLLLRAISCLIATRRRPFDQNAQDSAEVTE